MKNTDRHTAIPYTHKPKQYPQFPLGYWYYVIIADGAGTIVEILTAMDRKSARSYVRAAKRRYTSEVKIFIATREQ